MAGSGFTFVSIDEHLVNGKIISRRHMKKTNKRLVVISDLHSGAVTGLTPPDWQYRFIKNDKTKRNKYSALQQQCWDFYDKTIQSLKPIDILVVNGDMIDGRGEKSGGTELIETDRQRQCEMAAEAIMRSSSDKIFCLYGTAYHSGAYEDFENLVADYVKSEKIGSHEWLDVNGVMFDFKHHLGSSNIPHGRFTPIARENLWSQIWAERDEQPKSDILVRSHVHYFGYTGNGKFLGITTPALQSMGSKFGSRRCSGVVDFGLVSFDIDSNGRYSWQAHLANIQAQKATAIKL